MLSRAIPDRVGAGAARQTCLLGLPFSLTLMFISSSRMRWGTIFTARHYRVYATPPFFVPFPSLIGTLGAFIRIKSPIPSRAALFDIGIAGPIAGFIPACIARSSACRGQCPIHCAERLPAGSIVWISLSFSFGCLDCSSWCAASWTCSPPDRGGWLGRNVSDRSQPAAGRPTRRRTYSLFCPAELASWVFAPHSCGSGPARSILLGWMARLGVRPLAHMPAPANSEPPADFELAKVDREVRRRYAGAGLHSGAVLWSVRPRGLATGWNASGSLAKRRSAAPTP